MQYRDKFNTAIYKQLTSKTSYSALSSDANSGQKDVTVSDGSKFSTGEGVYILERSGDEVSEQVTIDSISTNTLTMESDLSNTYETDDDAYVESEFANTLGRYVVSGTDYPTIFSGMAPSEAELENQGYTVNSYYPYISIYAPLTPGAAEQAFNASGGSKDVARNPSFQLTIYENTKHRLSKIQNVMDLADDALTQEFTREGLHLNPKDPTNGVPKWEEDEGHYWVWMRFNCTILESET